MAGPTAQPIQPRGLLQESWTPCQTIMAPTLGAFHTAHQRDEQERAEINLRASRIEQE
jgi:hypothetical protein